jgi:hypothetical protein
MKLIATRQGRSDKYDVLPAGAGRRLFDAVLALNQRWQALPWHGALELELPES